MEGKDFTERIDHVFSRQLLGGFLLAGITAKLAEKTVVLVFLGWSYEQFMLWLGYAVADLIVLFIYMYWTRIENWVNGLYGAD